jgi:hypothetical protein
MLKKDCRDILIQSFFFAVAMVALPAIIFLTRIIPKQPYVAIFMPAFQSGLLFWALFMGVSLFSSERGQKGMEYLLSLPYSRLQLLGLKVLPRFLSILFFYVVFLLLYYQWGMNFAALDLFSFSFLYCILFFISLCLSPLSDNFLVLSLVSLFAFVIFNEVFILILWLILRQEGAIYFSFSEMSFGFISLERSLEYWISFPLIILTAIFLLCPLGLAMLFSFKRFDGRPSKIYGRRYFKLLAPLLILGVLGAALTVWKGIDRGPKEFYLTQDHKLIESTYLYIKIYEKDRASKLKVQLYPYPFWDNPPFIYFDDGDALTRLNTATTATEIIYEPPKLKAKDYRKFRGRFRYQRTIALFEPTRAPNEIQLVLIDEDTRKVIRIPFKHDFFKDPSAPEISGTGVRDGKRYWLVLFGWSTLHPLRLWEDGRVEDIPYTEKNLDWGLLYYVNGTLIMSNRDRAKTILKEKDGTFVTVKKFPENDKPGFWLWNRFLENRDDPRIKEIYGTRNDHIIRMDLANQEIEDIAEMKPLRDGVHIGRIYSFFPDDFYYSEEATRENTLKIFKLEGSRITQLKTFEGFVDKPGKNRFDIFRTGIVIQKGKKVQVYSLPDFQEIKYKKLG